MRVGLISDLTSLPSPIEGDNRYQANAKQSNRNRLWNNLSTDFAAAEITRVNVDIPQAVEQF